MKHKLYNTDCLDYLETVKSGSVKCIFADIPDNLKLGYNNYDDNLPEKSYYNWVELLIRKSLPKCQIFWLSYYPGHDLEIKYLLRNILKNTHPAWLNNSGIKSPMTFIWRYTFGQYNDNDCAWGYRPIIRLVRSGTQINVDNIRRLSKRQLIGDNRSSGDRVPDNVWAFQRVVGNSYERCNWHPTQHPIELMKRIISMSLNSGERILDLCTGTGTTLRAVKELNENYEFHGCEISSFYCSEIQKNHTDLELCTTVHY